MQMLLSLLSFPVEILSSISVYLHPHKLHALRRLSRNAAQRLLLPPSFVFAHRNMLILQQQHPHLDYQAICWHKLGENYIAAIFAIHGVTYHSLSLLNMAYDESTQFDLESSPCASMIPKAMMLAAHHDGQYLARIKKPVNWHACDALGIQIASISGWTPVIQSIMESSSRCVDKYLDFGLDLASQNGHLDLVQYLLTFPQINLTHENSSAFRHACMNGHTEVVKALVQRNSTLAPSLQLDPLACDSFALLKASQYGHVEIVSFLVGAFVGVVDPMVFEGRALQLAIENGQAPVVQVFVQDWGVDWRGLKEEYRDVLRPFVEYLREKEGVEVGRRKVWGSDSPIVSVVAV
ncbi:UNVERIFIED_CONTAM: hypothetical protein HDU68_005755 [Siphonaria sp. JEL0065]|nr:hypothetical protein HDU68_005755 [Siphonaria sp. JEL0065]